VIAPGFFNFNFGGKKMKYKIQTDIVEVEFGSIYSHGWFSRVNPPGKESLCLKIGTTYSGKGGAGAKYNAISFHTLGGYFYMRDDELVVDLEMVGEACFKPRVIK
jgi:hypothetical protein